MIRIHFDIPNFKYRQGKNGDEIFDSFRKKWVKLTPEEWVRQNLLRYLKEQMHYPASMIAVERLVEVNDMKKRFDGVVFDRVGKPWMLIECKADTETLDDKVLQQILAYQSKLGAEFLLVSNGNEVFCWEITNHQIKEIGHLPPYPGQGKQVRIL
jgi:type I site-specific restriction endonuclease